MVIVKKPPVLKADVEDAIQHMKKSKSQKPNNTAVKEINGVGELL